MGSTQGGTTLVINGQYFDHTTQYPIVVNVAGSTCTVLTVNLTTIQCTTQSLPSGLGSQFQGGRGLQLYSDRTIVSQV